MEKLKSVPFQNVNITGGFWAEKQKQNREVTVYAVESRYEETGRFEAFKLLWTEGSEYHKPHFFWDSDVAKWMEAACYIYAQNKDEVLLEKVDVLIDDIEKGQTEDGYFNIFHTIVEPGTRFRNRDHHELYCLGHLIEAACAYRVATGSSRFIDVLDRYIDLVIRVFTVERSSGFFTPGHEEIELALFKLYRLTGVTKYRDLAMFFLDQRGVAKDDDLNLSWCYDNYAQSHLPVREQREAFGHAVRAAYLYSGIADAALEMQDEAMLIACKALFDDIYNRKMYITGGIGSSNMGEAFTIPYDMPNDTAYNETCASIAMGLFADRMKNVEIDSRYADVVEREMYNGALSGISLDGTSFFYENPLEINLSDRTRHTSVKNGDRLPITRRQKNFNCSCCPPNMTRYLASLGGSVFSFDDNRILVHQFMNLNASFEGIEVDMETAYPCSGEIKLTVTGAKGKTLLVRVPGWCEDYTVSAPFSMQNGYAAIAVDADCFTVNLDYRMRPVFYQANGAVRADAGKAAMMLGPVVYCLEKSDNPYHLHDLIINTACEPKVEYDSFFSVNTVILEASVTAEEKALYSRFKSEQREPVKVKMIPYFGFANRGESDMTVWFRAK